MLQKFLIRQKHRARNLYDFWRMEQHGRDLPGYAIRPGMLASGFHSGKATLYPFSRHDRRLFVSDWEKMYRLSTVNGHVAKSIFNNKLFYHLALQKRGYGDRIPQLIGLISQHGFTPYSEFGSLDEALSVHPDLFLKPMEGNAGRGIFVMNRQSRVRIAAPYIAEARITPHPYGAAINPGSLNTIRLLALRDVKTKRFFISDAVHRIGTRKTGPVDNFSQGGLSSQVDPETGTLSAAKWYSGKSEDDRLDNHPDTGAPIKDVVIPHWDEAKALALEVAAAFPDLLIIGWDVAITPKGPLLVEGNVGTPGLDLIQSHRPALLNPQVRDFMVHHGVVIGKKAKWLDRQAGC